MKGRLVVINKRMTSIFTKISVFKYQYYKYEINSDIDVKNRKYEKLKIYGDDLRNSYIEILKNYIKELEKKIARFMKKSVIDRFMLSYKADDVFYDESEMKDILNKVINIRHNLEKITVNQYTNRAMMGAKSLKSTGSQEQYQATFVKR